MEDTHFDFGFQPTAFPYGPGPTEAIELFGGQGAAVFSSHGVLHKKAHLTEYRVRIAR